MEAEVSHLHIHSKQPREAFLTLFTDAIQLHILNIFVSGGAEMRFL